METRKAETRFCELKDNDIRIIVETQKTGGEHLWRVTQKSAQTWLKNGVE